MRIRLKQICKRPALILFGHRNCFSHPRIYRPGNNERQWASSSECKWRGPKMYTKRALQDAYNRILGKEQTGKLDLLFHYTLSVAPISGFDIVFELRRIKYCGVGNLEDAQALYKCLSESKDAASYRYDLSEDTHSAFNAYKSVAKQRNIWIRSPHIRGMSRPLGLAYDHKLHVVYRSREPKHGHTRQAL